MALFAVAPAGAQEQVGAIEGSVTDESGAVLPGATVEAVSAGGTRLAGTTNESGAFRFPRVPPGTYVVIAKLDGFNPAEVTNVAVRLGDTVIANITLEVGAVSETISVVGEAGQVDVKSSATAASISAEQIELLPKGRDFTGVATQAAGAANEGFLGGISIDGASGSENRFVIDGVDTTHPQDGVSGQNMVTDFVEEVQVKSAGYAAEYGGSVGGVISAVTKSGTNEFKGWVGMYYGDSSMNGDERATPYRSDPSLYRTFDKDDTTTIEPGFAIGGPIAQDAAWFYVGYTYTEVDIDRTPDPTATRPSPGTYNRNDKSEYLTGNIKGNVGSQFLYKVSANLSPRTIDGNLPNKDGSTSPLADLSVVTEFETESYSAYADYIPVDNFYLSGRIGFWSDDTSDSGLDATEQIFFRTTAYPIADSPLFRPAGFTSFPGNSSITTDLWERESASIDGNLFVNGLGSHAFKAGVQMENISNEVSSGEAVNLYTFRWGLPDRFGAGVQGTYGSLGVRRFRTEGAADSKNLGFYLQDSWSVLPEPDGQPRCPHRAGARSELRRGVGSDAARERHRVRVRRQGCAARRLRLGRHVRPEGQGLRFVGHLLRHHQARDAPRLVRRGQVARVPLAGEHARLAGAHRERQLHAVDQPGQQQPLPGSRRAGSRSRPPSPHQPAGRHRPEPQADGAGRVPVGC